MSTSENKKIQENLKKLLFEHELTPTELARRIDLPQQTIQRVVKGKIKKPHQKTLEAIAHYFKINTKELTAESQEIFFSSASAPNTAVSASRLNIPVYLWEQLSLIQTQKDIQPLQTVVSNDIYNKQTFGVIMHDSSMSPYFPKGCVLIIEPKELKEDRSFILVHIKSTNTFLFRQALSDGENFFLKALSTDLAAFPMRKLDAEDKIIGVLVETRQTQFQALEIT